jgi:hypothetical protein
LGLAGPLGVARAQEAPASRGAAAILDAAGDLRVPANRRAAVADLRNLQADRKAVAIARARLRGLPVRVDLPDGSGARELMRWDGEQPFYYATCNANAAISTGSNLIRVSPYFADGAGWTVGVWDAGSIRSTHQEFGGRVTIKDGAANHYHSTHVGGTIGATGVVAGAIGMARAVKIDSYDWNLDLAEMSDRGASYGGEAGRIYVSNHSYGGLCGWAWNSSRSAYEWYGTGTTAAGYEDDFGRYNEDAQSTDSLAYSLPYYLMFWAAGNDRNNNPSAGGNVALEPGGALVAYSTSLHPPGDGVYRAGYDTISYMSLAKNVVTIGAVNDAVSGGVRSLANATITTFSGWGPTDDGRIKPDVVANGASLYSTYTGSDTSYAYLSGTSMATPNAVGTAQQILGYHQTLFPGQYLRASTLKGLLIHTADDLGTAGPDYQFGWGLINAKRAAELLTSTQTNSAPRLSEQSLATSVPTRTHNFDWDGVSPIRVTLCWTDPAGPATATHDLRTARLVNNLNLRVVGPTGTVHLPYVMPFVGNWTTNTLASAAIPGTNNADNVEQVYVASPPASGTYQAVVSYSGVLSGSPQSYSLLVSGSASLPPDPQSVTPDSGETGSLSLSVLGEAFVAGATVAFVREGQPDVPVSVSSVTPTTIDGTVDVSTMAQGLWGVRVQNPDGKSGTLPGCFAVVSTLWNQNFDTNVLGWTTSVTLGTGGSGWLLTTAQSHTPPSSYTIAPPAAKKTDNLLSDGIALSSTAQSLQFRFWHKHNIEVYDGGMLQFSLDGGTFFDVTSVGSGASFVRGAYTGTVAGRSNPNNRSEFYGQSAWYGNNGSSFSEVVLALEYAVYAGKTLRARWRLGTDSSNAIGTWYWYVDSVRVSGYDTANLPPTVITPAGANPVPVTGLWTTLSVEADDDGGEAALAYTWTANESPDTPVAFSTNGNNAAKQTTATFAESGDYAFVVTVRDSEGLTVTSAVAVAVQATPTAIAVLPAAVDVGAWQAQPFAAMAYDQFAQLLDPQPTFSWDLSGGGTIGVDGVFTAGGTAGGPHVVTASALGVDGTAQVTVLPPPTLILVR